MDWQIFKWYLNEGLEAKSFQSFRFAAVKLQVHWMATLGQDRLRFMLATLLGLPLAIGGYWLAYETEFVSQDIQTFHPLAVLMWGMIAIPAQILPVVYPTHLFVAVFTGAFHREFWECVKLLSRQET